MTDKVLQYAKKFHMLQAGDAVAAGVSGGADSVCLFLMLCKLRETIPFRLFAVHINHKIRPDAGEDAAYVKKLCREKDVPFFLVECDVEEVAREKKISPEEAGRYVRYKAFSDCLYQNAEEEVRQQRAKIAVAHQQDDRAETMLFHLFRGTGLKGLCGILPVSKRKDGISVIRPLLCLSRQEIEAWLMAEKRAYCTDSTNETDEYTRNRIRHYILPAAKKEVSESATENMNRTMDLLTETQDFIEISAGLAAEKCVVSKDGREEIDAEAFCKNHICLQRQILLSAIERLLSGRKDITAKHLEDILRLFSAKENCRIDLPRGLCATRQYGLVILETKREKEREPFCITLDLDELKKEKKEILLPDGRKLTLFVKKYKKTMNIPQNRYTKWFDCDRIKKSLEIRTRRRGDFLTVDENGAKKSLQDYMVNEKIPRDERDFIPLLAEGSHILWVTDYRISSFYKVNEHTKSVLQAELEQVEETDWN